MEMNRAEMAAVDGVACVLLDSRGRLVVTPNALTCDGQRNVPADLQPGETLEAFLRRHVPGIESGAWTVMIGGATVPRSMWARTWPKHGQLIACRAVVAKQVVQLAAIAALSYFTMGGGAGWIAKGLGVAAGGFAASAAGMGAFMAGSMLINKVLGPKVPKVGEAAAARQVHSLTSQRNSPRPYESMPTLWGEMRVTPDLAGQPYAWFEGDDQYLSTILLGGVNVHSASDLAIGDTPLTSFEGVSTFFNGFSGMPSQGVPLYSNADSIVGGELVNDGPWVTRTSSADTIALQVDIEGQLYDVSGDRFLVNSVPLLIETRRVGASAWTTAVNETLSNAATDLLRRTYTLPVAQGQHEVRVRIGKPLWDEGEGKDACKLSWNVLKSIQPDSTDYSQWGRIGLKIKATGQISGGLDTVRATFRARPLPVWNGAEWITATTRVEGLSNPGAILLQTLRGVYANGVLQFGFGMSDEQIDIEGLKAFMLHCKAHGYTYDRWITGSMSLGQFCEEVALAGMGEFSWTDGSRPTAVFVSSGQPLSGVVNMANMLKGSFSVAYNLANAADGIEYQYLDRDRNWETRTLRVAAPGVTTMLSPARITGEGVTSEAHAAVLARYHLAQSLYQYKTIDYGADIEHLAYRRLSVLSISHDLTQWGFGGRVLAALNLGDAGVMLQLDEPVPPMAQAYVGLRVPGARDYRVFKVEALEAESEWITLVEPWPAGVAFPGADLDNPAHDTLWCYDFKATPGYRVRVVGMQPEADLKGAQVTCVPEGPEFWDYVLNGTYTPAPNQSSLPQLGRPKVTNLRITEKVNVQGDTEWYSLSLVWDVEGDYDHAQVWAGRDGSELRLVDGNAVGSRAEFRIDGAGEWLIEVRPFNASGLVGQAATVLYVTTQTQLPPRNVDEFVVQSVAGGLRRFAWLYTGDRPPAFAGVQIRYVPGDVQLSVADWEGMQPLGDAGDIYKAQFETTRPQAGLWTFGCRAIDTAGQLANGVVRFVASLGASFEQVQQPDMTPPPAVTGLTAEGMLANVQANWDAATYTVGHGHARTIIYAAQGANATFAQAEQVAEAFGGPVSFGSEPATTWKIWAKHQTVDGVLSQNPSQPVTVTTGQDAEKLLEMLQGQLTESQLHQNLAKEIELISGGGVGSVNARLIAEAQARAQAVAVEAQARLQDLAAEAQARANAVGAEAAARQAAVAQVSADLQAASQALQGNINAVNAQVADIIGAGEYDAGKAYASGQLVKRQGKLYRSKSAVPAGNPPPAAAYWVLVGDYESIGEAVAAHAAQLADHSVRIGQTEQGLTAEATSRNALAVQLRGNYTGADLGQVTSGLVWSERQARVTGDSANASAIQAVSARMPSGTGAVAAAADVVAEQQARVAGDGANATAIQAVTARMPAGSGKVATEASVTDETTARASGDSALASRAALIEARLPAGTGQLATTAQVFAEEQARVAGDGANASLIQGVRTDLTSTQGTVAGQGTAINGLQSSVTSINGTLTSQAGSISQLQASVGSASTGLQALNALGSESEWIRRAGNPAANLSTKVESTAAAGAVLVLGANSGNDGVFVQHSATLPLDETRLYKFKTRYRRTAGGAIGPIYAGIIALGAGKTTFVNPENVETPVLNSGHYAVLGQNPPVNNWITVEYYYKGRSAGASTGNGTKASPRTFANKTAHLALIFAGNYPNLPGICELDFITFEDVTDVERISADATTEATVRADADSALASRAALLEARMPVGTGQLATASALQSLDGRVAAAEGVNSSQSNSLTQLTNTLNGLEVGGANLYAMKANRLANEQGAVTATWLTEDWVRLTVTAFNAAGTSVLTRFDDCFVATDHVIEAGKIYSVSAEVLLPVTTPVSFYTYIGGAGGPITARSITQPVANKWARIVFEGVVSRGAATGGVNSLIAVAFSSFSSDLIGKSFEIRNLQVEPGNKATAYRRPAALVAASINAKADSTALAALDSKVTGQGNEIISQGTSLTSLTNKVNHATTGLDAKASSAALASLDSKVTTQDETITSHGTAITSLTNNLSALSGVVDTKASSSALATLDSKVTQQGSTITSQGGSITTLNNSVSAIDQIVTIRDTRNDNNPPSFYWANYPKRTVREFKFRSVIGAPGTSSYGTLETTARWTDASGGPVVQVFTPGESLDQYTRFSTSTTAWSVWKNAVRDLQSVVDGKADATAVQSLTNRVTAAEGVNSSQSDSITSLTNSLSGKADASALATLQSTVTSQGNTISSQGSSLTSLTNSLNGLQVGGANLYALKTNKLVHELGTVTAAWLADDWARFTVASLGAGNVVRFRYDDCFVATDHAIAAGKPYSVSFEILSPVATGLTFWAYIGGSSQPVNTRAFSAVVNTWTRVVFEGVLPVGTATAATASLVALQIAAATVGQVFEIRNLQVEPGNKATAYRRPAALVAASINSKAEASALASLQSTVTQQGNTLTSQGSSITSLTNTIDNRSTGLASKASAAAVSSLTTRVVSAEGLISSHTEQINQVQATAAGNSSAIQQNASAQANTNGHLGAQYSLKVQLSQGGKSVVGGFAVSGTSSGTAGPRIDFGVLANQFWITAPSGTSGVADVKPFVVQTTAQTVNGVTVPAGVYMDAVYINNVTALWARFGTLVADTIKATEISVSKLVAGSLAVGQHIQSTSYVAGSAGWRIHANGTAEFSGIIVRGTIHATAGTIGTFSINSNGLNSGGYSEYAWPAGNATGVHISHRGILIGNVSTGKYIQITETGEIYTPHFVINANEAIFGGRLNGASGTFSGSLTAQAVNAVNTVNIAGNAVTVPVGGTGYGSVPGYWVSMPQGGAIIAMVAANYIAESSHGQATVSLAAKIGDIVGPGVAISLANLYSGSATAMFKQDVGPGNYFVTGVISFSIGIRTIGGTSLAAFGAQR